MRRGRPPYPELLTPREQEVLELLRQGLSNRQIAERLGISYNGARYHVSEILSKLGVSTREEAAAWQGEVAGQRRRWFGFVPLPGLFGHKLSLEDILKTSSVAAIGAVAIGAVLLTAGVVVMQGRASDSQEAALASPTPGENPMAMLERRIGPFVAFPRGAGTTAQRSRSATTPPGLDAFPPAAGLAAARESSLFPQTIPDGYSVIDANSAGRSAEAHLELRLSGPNGELTIVRSYPEEVPIMIEYDPHAEEVSLLPTLSGIGLHPPGGDWASAPARIQVMESGIETRISGDGISIDEASRFYRNLRSSPGPLTAEHMLPDLPPSDAVLTGTATGRCEMLISPAADYVWETVRFVVHAWANCSELVELTPCAPGSVHEFPDLQTACDARGFRIDATWTLEVHGQQTCRAGAPAFAEGASVRSYSFCSGTGNLQGSDEIPLRVCASIRDQESCIDTLYSP